MKNLIVVLVFIILFTSCHCLTRVNTRNVIIPDVESKWYCFYVHDLELDMKYTRCDENDSTIFRRYHKEDRYVILDTLNWGTPTPD